MREEASPGRSFICRFTAHLFARFRLGSVGAEQVFQAMFPVRSNNGSQQHHTLRVSTVEAWYHFGPPLNLFRVRLTGHIRDALIIIQQSMLAANFLPTVIEFLV